MRLNAELPNEMYAEFAAVAKKQKRSISDVVRMLVSDWTHEQKLKEQFGEHEQQEETVIKLQKVE